MCSRSSACMCSTIVYVHLLRVVVLESRSVLLLDDPKFLSERSHYCLLWFVYEFLLPLAPLSVLESSDLTVELVGWSPDALCGVMKEQH